MRTGQFHAIPLSGHDNPIAVDYDPIGRKVYWTDVASKIIKRANLNGSEEQLVKLFPEGMNFNFYLCSNFCKIHYSGYYST